MFYKNWPYWLRGGFIGFVVVFVYSYSFVLGTADLVPRVIFSLFFAVMGWVVTVTIVLILFRKKSSYSYWLRGGLLAVSLWSVYFFILNIITDWKGLYFAGGTGLILLPFYAVFIFLIGSIVGLIYGKIKSKR